MNNDKEAESFCGIEGIEKQLKVIEGEGSGEPKVVEKKKIFFFGQAGCLKHSPIKTLTTPNHNNHSKPVEIPTTPSITEKESKVKETASDDEIYLQEKVSADLDDQKKNENSSNLFIFFILYFSQVLCF